MIGHDEENEHNTEDMESAYGLTSDSSKSNVVNMPNEKKPTIHEEPPVHQDNHPDQKTATDEHENDVQPNSSSETESDAPPPDNSMRDKIIAISIAVVIVGGFAVFHFMKNHHRAPTPVAMMTSMNHMPPNMPNVTNNGSPTPSAMPHPAGMPDMASPMDQHNDVTNPALSTPAILGSNSQAQLPNALNQAHTPETNTGATQPDTAVPPNDSTSSPNHDAQVAQLQQVIEHQNEEIKKLEQQVHESQPINAQYASRTSHRTKHHRKHHMAVWTPDEAVKPVQKTEPVTNQPKQDSQPSQPVTENVSASLAQVVGVGRDCAYVRLNGQIRTVHVGDVEPYIGLVQSIQGDGTVHGTTGVWH